MLASWVMDRRFYSIRMHSENSGGHLSGAERLAGEEDLERVAGLLVRRAVTHPRGKPDSLRLTVEALAPEAVGRGRLPDLRTITVSDYRQGREAALGFLCEAGVPAPVAREAIDTLARGAAPGGVSMRGAMLVDVENGRRLEPDAARGIRVSRMDLTSSAERELRQSLGRLGLDNDHVREALVLSAKVLQAPGIVAELCWSDDPAYTAGYVAAPGEGYVRFPHLKPIGDERGGRAFFLRPGTVDLDSVIGFLERSAILFDRVGELRGEIRWEG
jgi:6-carboxyhexanoate--CoA ligase